MMIARNLAATLRARAAEMPVVAVTGPRQSGKTTLCREVFGDRAYISLEPIDNRDFAIHDPRGFLHEITEGAVIDEVQRAPDLLSYLQEEVDLRPEPGRFIVTGSQHFGLTAAISQSLAGRVAVLHLLPPSLDELVRFGRPVDDLWQLVWGGSYPRIWDRELEAAPWLTDYVTTYIQRDVRQVLKVADLEAFTTFLRLMAGRTAAELNLSSLAGDAGVTHPTVRSWLSVLEESYLCVRLPAWHRSHRKQVVRTAKIHFVDSGLACSLLGITQPDQLRHHPLRGALFESWVVAEVLKARLHRGLVPRMFHYRESRGLEADMVVAEGLELIVVEAKSGATVAADSVARLDRLATTLADRERPELRVSKRLVHGGGGRRSVRSGAEVIPWSAIHDVAWQA